MELHEELEDFFEFANNDNSRQEPVPSKPSYDEWAGFSRTTLVIGGIIGLILLLFIILA